MSATVKALVVLAAATALLGIRFLLADDKPGGKEDSMGQGAASATAARTSKLDTATFALG